MSNWLVSLFSFVQAFIHSKRQSVKLKYLRTLAKLNALKTQVILQAYSVWSNRSISMINGFGVRRSGSSVAAAATKGAMLLVEIIMLTIAAYFTAFLIPGALTAIATTALTSVSTAVQTLFQVVLSLVIVATIIMLFLSVIVETFRSL